MDNQSIFIISFFGSLILMILIGYFLVKQDFNQSDKLDERNGSFAIISSAIIGSLVGGSATIGTVQMSMVSGLSAWWFTLGSGLGCFFMAIFYLKPIYTSKYKTLPEILEKGYGHNVATIAMTLMLLGTLFAVIAQIISGFTIISYAMNIPPIVSILIIGILMIAYVIGGGVKTLGKVGMIKFWALVFCIVYSFIVIIRGWDYLKDYINEPLKVQYLNIFSRGLGKDLNSGISLILGVLTTQTYIQIVNSGKSYSTSKKGLLFCSVVIPLMGIVFVAIGLFLNKKYPGSPPLYGLITFIMSEFNAVVGGIFMSTLLITVVGTSSGSVMGMTSMIIGQVPSKYQTIRTNRIILILISLICILISILFIDDLILDLGYFSMGLRASVGFIPYTLLMLTKERLTSKEIILSMGLSLSTILFFRGLTNSPLLFSQLIGCIPVAIHKYRKKKNRII